MENQNDKMNMKYRTIHGTGHLDNLDSILIGRILTIETVNNKVITGKLKALGMYDLVITDSKTGQDVIIMKSSIMTIHGDISVNNQIRK